MKIFGAQPGWSGSPFGGGLPNPEQFFGRQRFTIGHIAIQETGQALQKTINNPLVPPKGLYETPAIVRKLMDATYLSELARTPMAAETERPIINEPKIRTGQEVVNVQSRPSEAVQINNSPDVHYVGDELESRRLAVEAALDAEPEIGQVVKDQLDPDSSSSMIGYEDSSTGEVF